MELYWVFVKATAVLLYQTDSVTQKFLLQGVIIVIVMHKTIIFINGTIRCGLCRPVFLETFVQLGDIGFVMYSGFLPGGQDLVRIFETVPVGGQNGSFTGFDDNICFKSIFLTPAADKFRFFPGGGNWFCPGHS